MLRSLQYETTVPLVKPFPRQLNGLINAYVFEALSVKPLCDGLFVYRPVGPAARRIHKRRISLKHGIPKRVYLAV